MRLSWVQIHSLTFIPSQTSLGKQFKLCPPQFVHLQNMDGH